MSSIVVVAQEERANTSDELDTGPRWAEEGVLFPTKTFSLSRKETKHYKILKYKTFYLSYRY